jgi:TIR domain
MSIGDPDGNRGELETRITDRLRELKEEFDSARVAYAEYQAALAMWRTSPEVLAATSWLYRTVTELISLGLLEWDSTKNTFGLHPIVRGYAFDRLNSEEREAIVQATVNDGLNRPAPSMGAGASLKLMAGPNTPQNCFVSYAWNDRELGDHDREEIVDRLCAEATARGITIHRDRANMNIGDSIANFMQELASGSRVFVILSKKYLRSVFCMTELYEIWNDCRRRDNEFLKRILVYSCPDVQIDTSSRLDHVLWWKERHEDLSQKVEKIGFSALSVRTFDELRHMRAFQSHIDDILSLIADRLHPRTFEELVENGL